MDLLVGVVFVIPLTFVGGTNVSGLDVVEAFGAHNLRNWHYEEPKVIKSHWIKSRISSSSLRLGISIPVSISLFPGSGVGCSTPWVPEKQHFLSCASSRSQFKGREDVVDMTQN